MGGVPAPGATRHARARMVDAAPSASPAAATSAPFPLRGWLWLGAVAASASPHPQYVPNSPSRRRRRRASGVLTGCVACCARPAPTDTQPVRRWPMLLVATLAALALWPAWQQWRVMPRSAHRRPWLPPLRAGRSLAEQEATRQHMQALAARLATKPRLWLKPLLQTQNRASASRPTKPNVPCAGNPAPAAAHDRIWRARCRRRRALPAAPFRASAAQGGLYQPQWWVDRARWLQLRQQHERRVDGGGDGDQHHAEHHAAPAHRPERCRDDGTALALPISTTP